MGGEGGEVCASEMGADGVDEADGGDDGDLLMYEQGPETGKSRTRAL